MDNIRYQALQQLLAGAVSAVGYELLGYEYHPRGAAGLLRVYIDSETGINLDDCEKASRQISAVLDVEDPIAADYTLEVSSPGLNRPLFTLAHYQRFLGHSIKIRLVQPREGRRNFAGRLMKADASGIAIEVDDSTFQFSFDEIEKANLIADI